MLYFYLTNGHGYKSTACSVCTVHSVTEPQWPLQSSRVAAEIFMCFISALRTKDFLYQLVHFDFQYRYKCIFYFPFPYLLVTYGNTHMSVLTHVKTNCSTHGEVATDAAMICPRHTHTHTPNFNLEEEPK